MSTQSELASTEVRIDREDMVCRHHNHDPFEQLSISVLGMNAEELAQNPRLDSRIVHDVTQIPPCRLMMTALTPSFAGYLLNPCCNLLL